VVVTVFKNRRLGALCQDVGSIPVQDSLVSPIAGICANVFFISLFEIHLGLGT
jgi:hypothetical protein